MNAADTARAVVVAARIDGAGLDPSALSAALAEGERAVVAAAEEHGGQAQPPRGDCLLVLFEGPPAAARASADAAVRTLGALVFPPLALAIGEGTVTLWPTGAFGPAIDEALARARVAEPSMSAAPTAETAIEDELPAATELEALLERAAAAEAALDNETALAATAQVHAAAGSSAVGRRAQRQHAELLLRLGRNDDAEAAFDALIHDCEAEGVLAELARAHAERAHVGYRSGDGAALQRHAELAATYAAASGDTAALAHATRFVGISHEFAGRHAEAEATYLELLEIAPEGEHLGPVCNSLGEIARASGRFGTAVSWYRRFHQEWQARHGDEPNVVYLNNLGAALVELGRHDEGRALLDRAIHEQRRTGYLAMLSETYYYRGVSQLASARPGAARRDATEGYLLAAELGEGEMIGLLLRLLAQIRATEGDGAESPPAFGDSGAPEALLEQSIQVLDEAGKPAEVARSRWALGVLKCERGDVEAGRANLAAARAAYLALGLEHWAEEVARLLVALPAPPA